MPPKIEKALVNTVEVIDSDDDEGGVGLATTTSDALGNIETASHDGIQAQQTLAESQSFWKAGAYDVPPGDPLRTALYWSTRAFTLSFFIPMPLLIDGLLEVSH